MKNASLFYSDIINKVFTWNDKIYSTFKIQSHFQAKGGFGNISMLQKYKKATDFRLISWTFGITFGQVSNPYNSWLVPRIGTFNWLWPMDYYWHLLLTWLPTASTCTLAEGWRTKSELFVSPLGLSSGHSHWRLAAHLGFPFHFYVYRRLLPWQQPIVKIFCYFLFICFSF